MKRVAWLFLLFISIGLYAQQAPAENPKEESPKSESPVVQSPPETPTEPIKEPVREPVRETPKETPTPTPKPQPRPAPVVVSEEEKLLTQLESNPKNTEIYSRLFKLYTAEGKHKEKLKVALRAIQNLGGNANYYLIVGDENKFLGDFQKALISYQLALRILPTDHTIYNRIGLVHLKMSNFSQAESAFKASIYFSGNESTYTKGIYYNNLGVAYEWMHNLKDAYRIFLVALRYYPDYGTARENLNRVRENLKSAGIEVQ